MTCPPDLTFIPRRSRSPSRMKARVSTFREDVILLRGRLGSNIKANSSDSSSSKCVFSQYEIGSESTALLLGLLGCYTTVTSIFITKAKFLPLCRASHQVAYNLLLIYFQSSAVRTHTERHWLSYTRVLLNVFLKVATTVYCTCLARGNLQGL